jgi:NitT/TauT family transport system substrate-binding protein
VITHILVSTKFLNEKPELVKAFLEAHVQVTQDILKNPAAARKTLNQQLQTFTGKGLPDQVLDDSFAHINVLLDPLKDSLFKSAGDAFALGFLGKDKPNLDGLYDLKLLNSVLAEKGLAPVS